MEEMHQFLSVSRISLNSSSMLVISATDIDLSTLEFGDWEKLPVHDHKFPGDKLNAPNPVVFVELDRGVPLPCLRVVFRFDLNFIGFQIVDAQLADLVPYYLVASITER